MSLPRKLMPPASVASAPEIWPTSVVLPAPFGPISACTSPCATSSVTRSVATTPPKRFDTPLSSSTAPPREQPGDAMRREQDHREQDGADGQLPVHRIRAQHLAA